MAHEMLEDVSDQLRVLFDGNLAEVGDLADLPEQLDHGGSRRLVLHARITGQQSQDKLVILRPRTAQAARRRQLVEALVEPRDR